MKDIIVISILDYEMTEIPDYYAETMIVDSKYKKHIMIEGIKFCFIELPKFRKYVKKPKNKLEEWLAFIDYEREELVEMATEKNPLVKQAKLKFEYLQGDEAIQRLEYLKERAMRDELAAELKGRRDGEKKGERKSALKIAKEMLKKKIEKNIIIQCTGISDTELEKIIESI